MISPHSRRLIQAILEDLGFRPILHAVGEIEFRERISPEKLDSICQVLVRNEFEVLRDKDLIIFEKIKSIIIEMIHYSNELPTIKYSEFISSRINTNYTYLSRCFSRVKGITIERFIILQKIEKVKQLLLFNELTLSEIAWKLQYSSTAHLSSQFKKITGLTPSLFKRNESKDLISPENI